MPIRVKIIRGEKSEEPKPTPAEQPVSRSPEPVSIEKTVPPQQQSISPEKPKAVPANPIPRPADRMRTMNPHTRNIPRSINRCNPIIGMRL